MGCNSHVLTSIDQFHKPEFWDLWIRSMAGSSTKLLLKIGHGLMITEISMYIITYPWLYILHWWQLSDGNLAYLYTPYQVRTDIYITIGHVTQLGITVTTNLVPYHFVKSLLLIWRSGTRRWYLWITNLQLSCSGLTSMGGCQHSSFSNSH